MARLSVPTESSSIVQSAATVGVEIPARQADCTGSRPSWHPVVFNDPECDDDAPDPPDLTDRQRRV